MVRKLAQVTTESVGLPRGGYTLEDTGVTQGLLADFVTCRQRFLFRINGWRPIESQNSDALYFGSLVHHVLERFYKSQTRYPATMLTKWLNEYFTANRRADVSELEIKARALLTIYFELYGEHDRKKFKPLRVEETFSVPHAGVQLRGRKDYVFQIKKPWMMEHKTKSQIDLEWLGATLAQDTQNSFYDLSEFMVHGNHFEGIIYNILRTPQLRLKKTESVRDYATRLIADVRANPGEYFYRYEVTFTQRDRSSFKQDLGLVLDEMKLYMQGKLANYRNRSACRTPYRCNYLRACSSGFMTGYEQKKIIFPELEN